MSENKTVLLSDILVALEDIDTGTDNPNHKKLHEIKSDITIAGYMPIYMKRLYIDLFLEDVGMVEVDTEDFNTVEFVFEVEKLILLGLLFRYTNINVDDIKLSDDDYDLLYQYSFVDEILKVCEKDFNKLKDILGEVYRVDSTISLYKNISSINADEMNGALNEMGNMLSGLSTEQLKHMNSIVSMNDPLMSKIKKQLTQYKK